MKKIVLIVGILILLTGCSAEVNINISDGKIEENVLSYETYSKVYPNGNEEISQDINLWVESFERGSYEMDYTIKTESIDSNKIGRRYNATFNFDDWSYYSIIKKCYNSYDIKNTDSYFSIITDNEYVCGKVYNAKDVVLKITTDYLVTHNNADEVKDNTYIWYINDDTYEDEKISFTVSKNRKVNTTDKSKEDRMISISNTVINGILISIGAVILIGSFIIIVKVKNSNK